MIGIGLIHNNEHDRLAGIRRTLKQLAENLAILGIHATTLEESYQEPYTRENLLTYWKKLCFRSLACSALCEFYRGAYTYPNFVCFSKSLPGALTRIFRGLIDHSSRLTIYREHQLTKKHVRMLSQFVQSTNVVLVVFESDAQIRSPLDTANLINYLLIQSLAVHSLKQIAFIGEGFGTDKSVYPLMKKTIYQNSTHCIGAPRLFEFMPAASDTTVATVWNRNAALDFLRFSKANSRLMHLPVDQLLNLAMNQRCNTSDWSCLHTVIPYVGHGSANGAFASKDLLQYG